MTEPIRVVAVVSFRHSGSTVLGAVLGASPSGSMVGETDRALVRRTRGRLRCRCTRSLAECEHWSVRVDRLERWPSETTGGLVARLRSAFEGPTTLAEVQRDLWEAAAAARGTTLVDTSKHLRALRRLARDAHVDLHVVHLVRAPGPTVASSLRGGERTGLRDAGSLRRHLTGLAELARWAGHDLGAAVLLAPTASSYRRLDFEAFTDRPDETTAALCDMLDLAPVAIHHGEVDTGELHLVWGNRGVIGGRLHVRPADGTTDGLPRLLRPVAGALERLRHRGRRHRATTLRDQADQEPTPDAAVSSS